VKPPEILTKFPLIRLIREWDYGSYCPQCGSSLKLKFLFFKTKKCIQPECENYYKTKKV